MFVTEPQHELSIVSALGTSGRRHWRLFQLSLHAHWFVVTVEVPDGDVVLKQTACVAWDTDLVALLDSLGQSRAVSLLCMTPGWSSPSGQWAARTVREVWTARNVTGDRVILLRDEHGSELGDPSSLKSSEALTDRQLILRLGVTGSNLGDVADDFPGRAERGSLR